MSKRSKYTAEEKFEILKAYDRRVETIVEICNKYGINYFSLYNWKYKYRKYGINGLKESKKCRIYSDELKELALKDYLSGQFSQNEIVEKYNITTKSVFEGWLNKYNVHIGIKVVTKGMTRYMTKSRSTSLKERIKIVLYCINHNKQYQQSSEVYNVSYKQVYNWVKKFESGGEDELKDRRGLKKLEEELTPEDKTKLSMKKIEMENERLRAENAFLKKLEELEGGRL